MNEVATSKVRFAGPDVTRAIALIGVVVMNYHGYLNHGDDGVNRSFAERVFDPWNGPLATRFAATFVTVAGVGVTLLTNRSRLASDRAAIRADRWRLVRRGLLLYTFGLVIEWIWNGTILFYYGAFFMVAALLFTLRIRWLALVGGFSAAFAAWLKVWEFDRQMAGHDVSWLHPRINSPRNLLLRTFVDYTHPLFPWLAFVCVGIVLGRYYHDLSRLRWRIAGGAAGLLVGTYLLNSLLAPSPIDSRGEVRSNLILSTRPFDRGLLYTLGAIGSSVLAIMLISACADRFPTSTPGQLLGHAGQMTLSLYVAHVLVFNAAVTWWGWVQPTGLDTALVFSFVFWVLAIGIGAWWHRFLGVGPLERIYRNIGG